jgi:hypothetical protein
MNQKILITFNSKAKLLSKLILNNSKILNLILNLWNENF